jgi:glycosyltransferase involved in cell wall biosynthesis
MLCSWLDPKTGTGSFFWEQAGFMTQDFNMILCGFNNTHYGVRNFNKFFSHQIVSVEKAPNGLTILKFNYPQVARASEKFNLNLFRSSIRKFQKYLLQENISIDLIHAQSLLNAGIVAQYFYEETGVPYVFTEHNQFNYRSVTPINKQVIEHIFLNDFDKMVVSYDKMRQLSSNGLYADYISVGNTIDDEIFNYKERNSCNAVFKILTIGAYAPIKDHETLLKSLQLLDEKLLNFLDKKIEFIWLGYNGWGNESSLEIKKLFERFSFKNIEVTLIAKVERLEVKNYLQDTDIFLLTSISEGMPVSVMEALACGVPVCSTRCGGVDELIDDSNGRIFQIKDSVGIADFIADFYMKKYKFENKSISEEFIKKWGKEQFKNKIGVVYNRMITKYSKN